MTRILELAIWILKWAGAAIDWAIKHSCLIGSICCDFERRWNCLRSINGGSTKPCFKEENITWYSERSEHLLAYGQKWEAARIQPDYDVFSETANTSDLKAQSADLSGPLRMRLCCSISQTQWKSLIGWRQSTGVRDGLRLTPDPWSFRLHLTILLSWRGAKDCRGSWRITEDHEWPARCKRLLG